MDISNYTIKVGSGKYTYLDKAYRDLIKKQIHDNESWYIRWEIYDMIIKEIISLENEEIFNEIKYRVTDGENVNDVLLSILENKLEPNLAILSLIQSVRDYSAIDWLKNFCG